MLVIWYNQPNRLLLTHNIRIRANLPLKYLHHPNLILQPKPLFFHQIQRQITHNILTKINLIGINFNNFKCQWKKRRYWFSLYLRYHFLTCICYVLFYLFMQCHWYCCCLWWGWREWGQYYGGYNQEGFHCCQGYCCWGEY